MGAWGAVLANAGALSQAQKSEQVEYLWPENVQAWDAWQSLQTQWRVGVAGATGLDYAGVRAWLLEQWPDDSATRQDVLRGIQACEAATLAVWAKQRKEDQDKHAEP